MIRTSTVNNTVSEHSRRILPCRSKRTVTAVGQHGGWKDRCKTARVLVLNSHAAMKGNLDDQLHSVSAQYTYGDASSGLTPGKWQGNVRLFFSR